MVALGQSLSRAGQAGGCDAIMLAVVPGCPAGAGAEPMNIDPSRFRRQVFMVSGLTGSARAPE
jgi:hypothetical protein